MILFFDTSALVKYFHVEKGTEQVTTLINDSNNEIWVLELARIEFISALFRKYRAHIINDKHIAFFFCVKYMIRRGIRG